MERKREPLDMYDTKPREMKQYLRDNGYHFNKKMCELAVSMMRRMNPATGKTEKIDPWTKEKVDELLVKHGITLENNSMHDYVYVANMAAADFYKSSLKDEASLAQFIKDYVDDPDQADGFIFNRFYADMVRSGRPIDWIEVL